MEIDAVLKDLRIWRFGRGTSTSVAVVPTGFAPLDACLPGGGWPLGALTEILSDSEGIGRLSLVMPALARLSQTGRWLVWVEPPYVPYAPALAACGIDLRKLLVVPGPLAPSAGLWTAEQALRLGSCGAVLSWPERIDWRALRRLQLAAEIGRSWGLIFRPGRAAHATSPAALRLLLEPDGALTLVRLLKCRGGSGAAVISLDLVG